MRIPRMFKRSNCNTICKGEENDPCNLRPLSVLPTLRKKPNARLNKCNVLHGSQSCSCNT